MLQDIAPHRLDLAYSLYEPAADDYVLLLSGTKILLVDDCPAGRLPTVQDVRPLVPTLEQDLVHLFRVDDTGVFLSLEPVAELAGFRSVDLMTFRSFEPTWLAFAAVTAAHLGGWYAGNRYCGHCGKRTRPKDDERAVLCDHCGVVVYPRISPAVIVGVTNGDAIVMTRYANRPNSKLTALIAGFMEVGETFEDTVRREVREEIGLRVKNIRYYKSQPWAFSGSVLCGFYCDVDGPADLTVDKSELQEAVWIKRADLPEGNELFSLTATMVEMFRRDDYPR